MSELFAARLHKQLHRLPGMPPHSEAALLNQTQGARRLPARRPALHNHDALHANPPRILVGWQNWIAGLAARRPRR